MFFLALKLRLSFVYITLSVLKWFILGSDNYSVAHLFAQDSIVVQQIKIN